MNAQTASGAPGPALIVMGTRPEAIKLFPVIRALQADPAFSVLTCVTGQHRELLDQVLGIAGVTPHFDLDVMAPGQDLGQLTAALLVRLGQVMDDVRPARVIVQGDTASALCAAMAAFHRRIPVAHVEAGLRSGDIAHPFPEEANRRMIATLADLHFAPTESAAQALLAEGVDANRVHMTGNTVIDALQWMADHIAADAALGAGIAELEARFAGQRLIAVTCHRRENHGQGVEAIADALARLAARGDVGIALPLHPNPAVRDVLLARLDGYPHIALLEPLDYPHFVRLLWASHLVLTDSGGIQEEAPALGKPVLVLRETTERPEGVAAGTARLVGTDADRIVAETERLLDDADAYAAMSRAHNPYGDGQAAQRIADILRADHDRPS
ncbi:MAG: UDP-N-acetylglucosamine 2-epimerase (non-hydrolyzing) [Novosphingobium sp.]|nr:UDP-N-acetylglucosamine 2-epimerase (non-hydrolyzing) [Novosphingobium sp.]